MRRKRLFFYLLLFLFLLSRLNLLYQSQVDVDTSEISNLFTASIIARYAIFSPSFFHINIPYAGGGEYLYSILAAPFIKLLGSFLLSLRYPSMILGIVELALIYYLSTRYFNLGVAILASLLFTFSSKIASQYAIAGLGRHFHLNLLFLLSLIFLLKFKEKRNLKWMLLFAFSVGLGIYFYPAFLISTIIFTIFFLSEIDQRKFREWIRTAGVFFLIFFIGALHRLLFFQESLVKAFSIYPEIIIYSPKNLTPEGGLLLIAKRFLFLLTFSFPSSMFFSLPFSISLKDASFWNIIKNIISEYCKSYSLVQIFLIGSYELLFLASIVYLSMISLSNFKKLSFNLISRKKRLIDNKDYLSLFLVFHFLFYIFLFALNKRGMSEFKYYLPLFVNFILLVALFISKRKKIVIPLSLIMLFPTFFYHYQRLRYPAPSTSGLLLPVFYNHYTVEENLIKKRLSLIKKMIQLSPNVAYTLGDVFAQRERPPFETENITLLASKTFGQEKEEFYFYEGWLSRIALFNDMDILFLISKIETLEDSKKKYAYSGLGSAVVRVAEKEGYHPYLKIYLLRLMRKIVKSDWKPYFYQGLGREVIRTYAMATYESNSTLLPDIKLFKFYLQNVEPEYIENFIKGFLTRDCWTPI